MARFLGLAEFHSQMFSHGLLYVQTIYEHFGFAYIVYPYLMRESDVPSANGDCGDIAFALYQLLMSVKSQPSTNPARELSISDLKRAHDLLFELFLAADGERMDYVIQLSELRSRISSSSNIRGNPVEAFQPVRGSFLNPRPNTARRHLSIKELTHQPQSLPGVSSLVCNQAAVVGEETTERSILGLPGISQLLLHGATGAPSVDTDSVAGSSKATARKSLHSVWSGNQASIGQHECSSSLIPRIAVPLGQSGNCPEASMIASLPHISPLGQQPVVPTETFVDVDHPTGSLRVIEEQTQLLTQPGDDEVQAKNNALRRESFGSIEGLTRSEFPKASASRKCFSLPSTSHTRLSKELQHPIVGGIDGGFRDAYEPNRVAFTKQRHRALSDDLPPSFGSVRATPAVEMKKCPRSQAVATPLSSCLDAAGIRTCDNCSRVDSRQWVRGRKEINEWLCHACGQYYRKNKRPRPQEFWSRPVHKRIKRTKYSLASEKKDLKTNSSEVSRRVKKVEKTPSACKSIDSDDEELTKSIEKHYEKEEQEGTSLINTADAEDFGNAPSIARTQLLQNALTVASVSCAGKESTEHLDDGNLGSNNFIGTSSTVPARSKECSSLLHARSPGKENSTRKAPSVLNVENRDDSGEITQGTITASGQALVAALLEFAAGPAR